LRAFSLLFPTFFRYLFAVRVTNAVNWLGRHRATIKNPLSVHMIVYTCRLWARESEMCGLRTGIRGIFWICARTAVDLSYRRTNVDPNPW